MKLHTKYHGTREYKEEDIITFKKGLPGFENLKKFIMFPAEENEVFNILHSVEDEETGFVVISPFHVTHDYEFELDDETMKELHVKGSSDVTVVNTVTVNSDINKITVNMRAPIVINIKSKYGEQIILNNEKYLIKQPLFTSKA